MISNPKKALEEKAYGDNLINLIKLLIIVSKDAISLLPLVAIVFR